MRHPNEVDQFALDPEITLSAMRSDDPAVHVETLEHIHAVIQQRFSWLAQHDPAAPVWSPSVITIIPSSEVLRDDEVLRRVEMLARIGRKADVAIQLLDAVPPIRKADRHGPAIYPAFCCGSPMLGSLASDPGIDTVSYRQIGRAELVMLAESI